VPRQIQKLPRQVCPWKTKACNRIVNLGTRKTQHASGRQQRWKKMALATTKSQGKNTFFLETYGLQCIQEMRQWDNSLSPKQRCLMARKCSSLKQLAAGQESSANGALSCHCCALWGRVGGETPPAQWSGLCLGDTYESSRGRRYL